MITMGNRKKGKKYKTKTTNSKMHININVPIQSFMEMVLMLYTGWLYNKQQTMFCYRSHHVQLFGNNNNML